MEEAPHHPHNKARETFIEVDGVIQRTSRRAFRERSAVQDAAGSAPHDERSATGDFRARRSRR